MSHHRHEVAVVDKDNQLDGLIVSIYTWVHLLIGTIELRRPGKST